VPTEGFVAVDKQCSRQAGILGIFYGCIPIGIASGLAKAAIEQMNNSRNPSEGLTAAPSS
jgi:hypothetical protein